LRIVFGELEVGEPMASPLIREVKKRLDKSRDAILDAPPGTSCPMIETVKGSDFCILVTVPTPISSASLFKSRQGHAMQDFSSSKADLPNGESNHESYLSIKALKTRITCKLRRATSLPSLTMT